ncbi:flagellar hook-associated protein FlgL [Sporolactobacillus sp. THM7-7]|nr:flagellar hook-associated protein FlgL [Sporolactobacillus sp. THM7-7]
MRITQNMMGNNILRQISNGYGKIADYQDQLASGKKITRPSQDPVVAAMGISYRTDVSHVEQYLDNVTTAYKWLDSSDDALTQLNDVLSRIRDLTVQASNGTYDAAQREAMSTEIGQLTEQIITIGNTQVGGQYIFSGADNRNPLLTKDGNGTITINQQALDHPNMNIAVNDGITTPISVDPNQVFTETLFGDLNDLQQSLKDSASTNEGIGSYLSRIDTHLNRVTNTQADLGALTNRIDMVKNRLGAQKTIATKVMSNNEDADYAETIINLNQQQNVYNASLSVGARIIQTSLVDFLK